MTSEADKGPLVAEGVRNVFCGRRVHQMPFEQEDGDRREGLGATHGLEGWGMGEGSFTFTKCSDRICWRDSTRWRFYLHVTK